ncbi:Ankyrin repeat containing protein [Gracilaria domingensis]|nr:Ankyrin repeat containing protein [Gracilaria domingensis]
MIARPDSNEPPPLEDFLNPSFRYASRQAAPIKLATGRSSLKEGSAFEAVMIAIKTASRIIPNPHFVHVTFGPVLDPTAIQVALTKKLKNIPLIARSVDKKGSSDVIEVLFLGSEDLFGVGSARVTENVINNIDTALEKAAAAAARRALRQLRTPQFCTFLMFAHTPGSSEAVRKGIGSAFPEIIAYGGPAIGAHASWTLFGEVLIKDDPAAMQTVICAAVPGSLSFLQSALLKNWVQPEYVEPLGYLTPKYMENPKKDLLTAIRYNDWDKFVWCIEEEGVPVNTIWHDKLNQSPLLAACMRMRPKIVQYLLEHGADVLHRNEAGYNAVMYTMMLSDYDEDFVRQQLLMLRDAGAEMKLSAQEEKIVKRVVKTAIVEI